MNENEKAKLARALKDAEDAIRGARAKGYDYVHDNAEGYPHCLDEAVRRLGPDAHYPVPRRAIAQAAGLLIAALIQHPDQSDGTAASRNPEAVSS